MKTFRAAARLAIPKIMMRGTGLALAACLLARSLDASPVSGKVSILEKGNARRAVTTDVLVYLGGLPAEIPEGLRNRPVKIASHNKAFEPHVEVVPVNGTVSFPNLDGIMHNVFSLSKGNRFDLGLYKDGAKKDHSFATPGLVRIYCNIHPQMSAFVQVMESPYYVWARNDGSFRLEDVPPGKYTLTAWHEEGEVSQPIVVTESGASGLTLRIDVSAYSKRPHLNKFGKPYKREKY